MDCKRVVENIRSNLKEYIIKYNLQSLVLGMSGGADSTLCAALARPVCDELGIKLIGRSLPIVSNKPDEIERARCAGNAFCHDFKEVNLAEMYYHFLLFLGDNESYEDAENKVRNGNIKARLRMVHLYDLAFRNKGMVLSTDNLTEYYLGFWTLHGDVGDYGMIQNLWKMEVYELINYLSEELRGTMGFGALRDAYNAIPTDGLGVSESDLEQFGVDSYNEVDDILQKQCIESFDQDCANPVVLRYSNSHFKRDNPYCIPREELFK
jgi:NAD+ synthetase